MVRLFEGAVVGYRPFRFTSDQSGEVVDLVSVFVGIPLTGLHERGIQAVRVNVTAKFWGGSGLDIDSNVRVCHAGDKWELVSDG